MPQKDNVDGHPGDYHATKSDCTGIQKFSVDWSSDASKSDGHPGDRP